MNITLHTIKIRELIENYTDNEENGVTGYGGKLDIRPPYQREFVYIDDKQQAVMDTICKRFPLNTMYWVERDDGRYEVLDGQQRTISICPMCKKHFEITQMEGDHKIPWSKGGKTTLDNLQMLCVECNLTKTDR